MKCLDLEFLGYTWDDYFYVIANKTGVLVVYRGGLDFEGMVKMDKLLYIGGAKNLADIYEANAFKRVRSSIEKGEKLFFSYAEVREEDLSDVVYTLESEIHTHFSSGAIGEKVEVKCKGACALFPERLLSLPSEA